MTRQLQCFLSKPRVLSRAWLYSCTNAGAVIKLVAIVFPYEDAGSSSVGPVGFAVSNPLNRGTAGRAVLDFAHLF